MKRKMEDMDEDLCTYCRVPEESRGFHCYGGLPVSCEGTWCSEAYETYLESDDDVEEADKN